ncbi:MAG: family 43 glycosylhydrolase [Bacteroidaceae bacterium]|nr:family 43 glycosylhydrolase [Bacteroidaceae bacterium]
MIADASIQLIDSTFYCYATTDGYGRGLETSGPPVVWKSNDFVHWHFEDTYFPSADGQKYWAPSKTVQRNGKWYIYPTVNGIMHVGVAESPDGPFRLARGKNEFTMPFAKEATLRQGDDRGGIDAEVFIDDDGQAYMFWGGRHVAKLADDMMTLEDVQTLETRRKEYSEGPIFFKRKGIYYYLYTIGGDENYEYYYKMSRTSPLGPYKTPQQDRVSTTNIERGVFGPGHGCVFNDGDDYYFAFLEFGRNSTNRQTYVNRMTFNDDGTIRPVEVSLDGVGALRTEQPQIVNLSNRQIVKLCVPQASASSVASAHAIRYFNDDRCQRTEQFLPAFAFDNSNGSRWMAAEGDTACWLIADLGQQVHIAQSDLCFVRPTQGHAYTLEGSTDGIHWKTCGGHAEVRRISPHTDPINQTFRYLRVRITEGIPGVWEWNIYPDN